MPKKSIKKAAMSISFTNCTVDGILWNERLKKIAKILNIRQSRQTMAEFFCDIEILRNEGEFEARVEGITPNVMSLKSANLEELLEQLTIELEDKLN